MNTPNKLTVLRALLIPVFLCCLYLLPPVWNDVVGLLIFAAACVTDAADGHLARKNGQITNFGIFLDPLADKVLVISALIYLLDIRVAPAVAVILIIAREFMVTSLRLVAVTSNGNVIPAGILGKIKTASQMVSIVLILLLLTFSGAGILAKAAAQTIGQWLIWICAILTVLSGIDYFVRNYRVIDTSK